MVLVLGKMPQQVRGAIYMVLSYLLERGLTSKNVEMKGFYCLADVNIGLQWLA